MKDTVGERGKKKREFEYSTDESVSAAVIRALATVHETDPLALPPLNDTLPCDALDALVDTEDSVTVTFSYEGMHITVHSNSLLVIRDPE